MKVLREKFNGMGYKVEFNWQLKLKPQFGLPKDLKVGKVYSFKKPEERIYPIDIPIELWDYEHDYCLAKVKILEFKVAKNKTEGKFKIIKLQNAPHS